MTIFGCDISGYEQGLDLARLNDAPFVLAKTTEGTYYTDADYDGWRRQAEAARKLFCWYHFLSGEDAHAQAAHTLAHVGDPTLPGMLDVELEGAFRPTLAQVLAYVDAAHAAGLNLRLAYLPHWYWQQMGSPDLTPLADRGIRLVSSEYPGGSGSAASLYPGDGAAGWQPYGNVTPLLYQFTDAAADGGMTVDMNAYRGAVQQLAAELGSTTHPTISGGTDTMALAPDERKLLDEIHQSGVDFANWQFFSPGGREQVVGTHAWRMQTTLDNTTAILARLGASPAAPVVDVVALAAALAPHVAVATDVVALAAALIPHLPGGTDVSALAAALVSHIRVV